MSKKEVDVRYTANKARHSEKGNNTFYAIIQKKAVPLRYSLLIYN
jgi:hypothetical protein